MSVERCLEIIERKLDQEKDYAGLFEQLSDLETETLEEEEPEDYHDPLGAFLERLEELFADEVFDKDVATHAAANLRAELEQIRDRKAPTDPLEHLFRDMVRYENGMLTSNQVLTTLSRYEELVLALRHHFEGSTDPTDERDIPQMMRAGLEMLEGAGKFLRRQLGNDTEERFHEIRGQFEKGAEILRDFRRQASFAAPEEEEEEEWD